MVKYKSCVQSMSRFQSNLRVISRAFHSILSFPCIWLAGRPASGGRLLNWFLVSLLAAALAFLWEFTFFILWLWNYSFSVWLFCPLDYDCGSCEYILHIPAVQIHLLHITHGKNVPIPANNYRCSSGCLYDSHTEGMNETMLNCMKSDWPLCRMWFFFFLSYLQTSLCKYDTIGIMSPMIGKPSWLFNEEKNFLHL